MQATVPSTQLAACLIAACHMCRESSIPKGSGDAGPDVPDGPNADMARAFHRLARLQEDNGANAFGIRHVPV